MNIGRETTAGKINFIYENIQAYIWIEMCNSDLN